MKGEKQRTGNGVFFAHAARALKVQMLRRSKIFIVIVIEIALSSVGAAYFYSHSELGIVVRYVQNQQEHHQRKSFGEEYNVLLKRFNVRMTNGTLSSCGPRFYAAPTELIAILGR